MRIPESSVLHRFPVNWELLLSIPNITIIGLIVIFWIFGLTVVWQAFNPMPISNSEEGEE